MKITVNVQEINDALSIVTRALAARAAKQILEGVLLDAAEDRLVLTCSDGKLTIEATVNATVQEDGRIVLPGRLLSEVVRKLPGGEMTLTVREDFSTEITCMRSRTKLTGLSALEFPELAEVERSAPEISLKQAEFKQMINGVVFAIATDESRQILTGCLLEVHPEEVRLVALDGFRLALQSLRQSFELPAGEDCLKAIVPGKVMTELGRVLSDGEETCALRFDRSHMCLSFGNARLSTALLAGEFIDYRRILPTAFKTTALVNRQAFQEALDRASIMAREGKNNLIKLNLSNDCMRIISSAEVGDQGEDLDIEMEGESLDIAFNAKYLTDAIRSVNEETLNMNFNSSISPCVFRPMEGDRFVYLILPVRVF